MLSLLEDFNDELPDALISADLSIGESSLMNSTNASSNLVNSNSTQQVTNTPPPQQQLQQQQQQQNSQTSSTPQPIQQGSPLPNSNVLNQQSSPQPPPSSISTSGDPTPAMPCVSSTPAHNVATSAGLNSRISLPMSPHMISHGSPRMAVHQMQNTRMRAPPVPSAMTGPHRVGMNQSHMVHPNMSPHQMMSAGMRRPGGVAMSGMMHQPMVHGMGPGGQVQIAGRNQYMHQHPSSHHGMHQLGGPHMVGHGVPGQQPMGGSQSGMPGHMMPGSLHRQLRPNMVAPGSQPHMVNMQGPNSRFPTGSGGGNPNAIRPTIGGSGLPNNSLHDDSQLPGSAAGGGMGTPSSNPLQGTSQPQNLQTGLHNQISGGRPVGVSDAGNVGGRLSQSPAPPSHPLNDIGGGNFMMQQQQQQQQQQQSQQQQQLTASSAAQNTSGGSNPISGRIRKHNVQCAL